MRFLYFKICSIKRDVSPFLSLPSIVREVERVFGRETLGSRRVALYLSHRLSGLPLGEIGRFFGMGPSGVSQNTRRVEVLLKRDKKLIKEVERVKKILSE